MPRYTYLCGGCGEYFETIHSMSQTQDVCLLCESDDIKKVPAQIGGKVIFRQPKVGDIVKDHIKKSREDLSRDKVSSKKELEN